MPQVWSHCKYMMVLATEIVGFKREEQIDPALAREPGSPLGSREGEKVQKCRSTRKNMLRRLQFGDQLSRTRRGFRVESMFPKAVKIFAHCPFPSDSCH